MGRDAFTSSRRARAFPEGDGGAARAADRSVEDPWTCLETFKHLSHEMRTPLYSILALSQLLRDGTTGDLNVEQQRYLEVMVRNGQNLIRLVNDVLDLSRIDLGQFRLDPRPVHIEDELMAAAASLAPLAEIKGVELEVAPCGPLPAVSCDPDRLWQVLNNLLGNAIKFTDRGRVDLSCERRGDVVAVHVTDTGVGIPETVRAHLFDQLPRSEGGVTTGRGGAGLGLAIASRLVRLMGGQLSVESAEGAGARFTFTLPIAVAAGEEEEEDGQEQDRDVSWNHERGGEGEGIAAGDADAGYGS